MPFSKTKLLEKKIVFITEFEEKNNSQTQVPNSPHFDIILKDGHDPNLTVGNETNHAFTHHWNEEFEFPTNCEFRSSDQIFSPEKDLTEVREVNSLHNTENCTQSECGNSTLRSGQDSIRSSELQATKEFSKNSSEECLIIVRPTKRRKLVEMTPNEDRTPVLYGKIDTNKGNSSHFTFSKILCDSGSSKTLISRELIKNLKVKKDYKTVWNTQAGTFITDSMVKVPFKLPELDPSRVIYWTCHVMEEGAYGMIMGRDLISDLKLNLDFSQQKITCDTGWFKGREAPMKRMRELNNFNPFFEDLFFIREHESSATEHLTQRSHTILKASYQKADLKKVVSESSHLTPSQQDELLRILNKHKPLFDGKLGRWKTSPVEIELKEGATPVYKRPYPIPRIHRETFQDEIRRLCEIGFLRKVNDSEWGAPTFIQPKKNGTVRFLSDFRELNKRIKRKPYPLPKIQEMLLQLEGFQWATSLDLNMGYYHLELSPTSRRLCTIVVEGAKYEYLRLPMGLCNSPDIFQEKMSELFEGFDQVRAYIDDLLIMTTEGWSEHLSHVDKVLRKLSQAGLKVNVSKSFFGKTECEYLGYWITRNGIQPLPDKVKAVQGIKPPRTKKELRSFIGLVNYYRHMWRGRSHLLAPLTKLTSTKVKFIWMEEHQVAFEKIKRIVAREVLLAYPDFNLPFDIHTDASKLQLGAVISQNGKPIAFYSHKLNPAQTRYTTAERELLSIVETLKEFKSILIGYPINVFTDHKNLSCDNFNTERVMRWRLLIEEFGPKIEYTKGSKNSVADALSRLERADEEHHEQGSVPTVLETNAEAFNLEELDADTFPLAYESIHRYQQEDTTLFEGVNKDHYLKRTFLGARGKISLICKGPQIVIPARL